MNRDRMDLLEQFVPPKVEDELTLDDLVRKLAAKFSSGIQCQMVIGGLQTGRTTLLAQFTREFSQQCICYFISPTSPLSQRQHTFLYGLCLQIAAAVGTTPPQEDIGTDALKNLFSALCFKLGQQAKQHREPYYFVVDGLENGLAGQEGDRIVDILPLQASSKHLCLLFSCRSDKLNQLPKHIIYSAEEIRSFTLLEVTSFLSGIGHSDQDIHKAASKCGGVPGYLRVLKEARQRDPSFDWDQAPADLSQLVAQQIALAIDSSDDSTRQALSFLAVSPVPLRTTIVSGLTGQTPEAVAGSLRKTGLVTVREGDGREIEFVSGLVQDLLRQHLASTRGALTRQLLDYIRSEHPSEEFLLSLLYRQAQDYDAVRKSLNVGGTIQSLSTNASVSAIMRRLQLAAEMAKERHLTSDLAEWVLGLGAAKAYLSHAASPIEIKALIALGEIEPALRLAYSVPEPSVRIRLLAQAYATMGDRTPRSALDELEAMASSLDFETTEQDVLRELAVDLLPVLPDVAVSLLERAVRRRGNSSLFEVAISSLESNTRENRGDSADEKEEVSSVDVAELLSSWLNDMSYARLLERLGKVETTEAREYILRQWCRQNRNDADLATVVGLWIDTVLTDRHCPIILRNVRQISEVLADLPSAERQTLAARLRVPGFAALDSPREEWARFRRYLIIYALEYNRDLALEDLNDLVEQIQLGLLDADVKAFCLAQACIAATQALDTNHPMVSQLNDELQKVLRDLLADSAEHYDLCIDTIESIAELDPDAALMWILDYNLLERRIRGIRRLLRTVVRKQASRDISRFIGDALSQLDEINLGYALNELCAEMCARELVFHPNNLDTLKERASALADPMLRAACLVNLARLYQLSSCGTDEELINQAIESWKQEDDLKLRLVQGFDMVGKVAAVDESTARQLYEEVCNLKQQSGASLAIGHLGAFYREVSELAMRCLMATDFDEPSRLDMSLETFINRIPSRVVRVDLFAKLAAAAYRLGLNDKGGEIVRSHIQRLMGQIPSRSFQGYLSLDYYHAVRSCLPVVAEYDLDLAKEMASAIPYPAKDNVWYSTSLWLLSRPFLGDHFLEPKDLQIRCDSPRLMKVIKIAEEMQCDQDLCCVIEAISQVVQTSCDSQLDYAAAFAILQRLDELSDKKLPERSRCNIRHEGYLVLAKATVHGARCVIANRALKHQRSRPLVDKKALQGASHTLLDRAERIPNAADRVFVLARIAPYLNQWPGEGTSSARAGLVRAREQVNQIPSVLDRAERLETIATSLADIGELSEAQFVMNMASDLAEQLDDLSAEDRLRMLVQAAHRISKDFAEELVRRFDSRFPNDVLNPVTVAHEIEQLRSTPAKITEGRMRLSKRGIVTAQAAETLLQDMASGRAGSPSRSVVDDWLLSATRLLPSEIVSVLQWAVECLRSSSSAASEERLIFKLLRTAELVSALADLALRGADQGIPIEMYDSYAGLNSVFVTLPGDNPEYARRWLCQWLEQNTRDYLKIVDPYFDMDQLEFLMHVPVTCNVLVVCVDHYLSLDAGHEKLRGGIVSQWHRRTSQAMPRTQLMIVPKANEDRFHGRQLASRDVCLNMGQSLNGLGRARDNIVILRGQDANELERSYIDNMLNNAAWFVQGVAPEIIRLGD